MVAAVVLALNGNGELIIHATVANNNGLVVEVTILANQKLVMPRIPTVVHSNLVRSKVLVVIIGHLNGKPTARLYANNQI